MNPVVLIAEELAPAAIEVLAHDFDVRHVDGAARTFAAPSQVIARAGIRAG
jgi:hypothetical protein